MASQGRGTRLERLKHRADGIAETVVGTSPSQGVDLPSTQSTLHAALVAEAALDLRQVLTHLHGRLELAGEGAEAGRVTLDAEDVAALLSSVDRASALVDTFLDADFAAGRTLKLDHQPFDLGRTAHALVERKHLLAGTRDAEVYLEPVMVEGDVHKLQDVLEYLIDRFTAASARAGTFIADVGPAPDGATCFIGCRGARVPAEELVAELARPVHLAGVALDLPYARVLVEGHGGGLCVVRRADGAVGVLITLIDASRGS